MKKCYRGNSENYLKDILSIRLKNAMNHIKWLLLGSSVVKFIMETIGVMVVIYP